MRLVVCNLFVPFEREGDDASELAHGLTGALKAAGHKVDLVRFPIDPDAASLPAQIAGIRLIDMKMNGTEGVDRLIPVGPGACAFSHPRKYPWYFDNGPQKSRSADVQNTDDIRVIEGATMREASALWVACHRDADRLRHDHQIHATGLMYPPPVCDPAPQTIPLGDSFLIGGPGVTPDDVALVLGAIARMPDDAPALTATVPWADGADATALMAMAKQLRCEQRFEIVPFEPDTLPGLLDNALAAIDLGPADRLCGRMTLEAFARRRAVVSVSEAGWVLELVKDEQTGVVTEPTELALAIALRGLLHGREETAAMGQRGFSVLSAHRIGWLQIVERFAA